MKNLVFIFPVITFFLGKFLGYFICRNGKKLRDKRIWSRVEQRNIMRTIDALVFAIDFKDHLTKKHSDNVKYYASIIAEVMGLNKERIEILKEACLLHDLGKIGVHDYILTKKGKLTESEWKEIKLHSLAGAVILKPFRFLDKIIIIIRQHHERYDGKGYPDGIKKEEISLEARIMAVADSFDAMIGKRPYRAPLSKEQVIEEFEKNSGTQFDPHIVEMFLKLLVQRPEFFKVEEDNFYEQNS